MPSAAFAGISANEQHKLDMAEYAMDHFNAFQSVNKDRCKEALDKYDMYFGNMEPATKATPQAKAIEKKHDGVVAACKKLDDDAAAAAKQRDVVFAIRRELTPEMHAAVDALTYAYDHGDHFDPPSGYSGMELSAKGIAAAKAGLAGVREVCHKHPGATDLESSDNPRSIYDHPVELCAMAEMGDKLVQQDLHDGAMKTVASNGKQIIDALQANIDGTELKVNADNQLLMFDRPAWLAARAKQYEHEFAIIGEKVPDDAFADVIAKADELKAKIDEVAPKTAWEPPGSHDAAVEKVVRNAWAKELPGVSVRAIGVSDKTWDVFDERTWVGSDDKYDYYKVNKGKFKYKSGTALLQIPNRPYCQARDWVVIKVGGGAPKIETLRQDGRFMKCP
ncbi:MAG TPA: hypothetical protein VL463_18420 [Kofleriaceae bacterium]|nr:hypothetical protein [Kofleriaceae bacterium]